jgi:2-haloacid dehalogenase
MSRYDLVLFDLDDTLFDFGRAEAQAMQGAFREAGLPLTARVEEAYGRINRALWLEVERGGLQVGELKYLRFRLLFEELGWKEDSRAFSRLFIEWLGRGVFPLPGAEETCRELAAKARLVLVTNGIAEVQRARIGNSALAPLLHGLVVSEDVGLGKPHAPIFERALELGGRPERSRVLMVGDSLASDIRGGADFGIDTCWYNPRALPNPGAVRPTHEVRGLPELLALV